MRVMVVGGAGYIGGQTAMELLKNNHKIVVVDNLETGHKETIDTLKKYGDVEFLPTDLRVRSQVADTFEKAGDVDAVMDFAAFSIVPESKKDPVKYLFNNVFGTCNLLNEMVKHHIDKIVFSSTAATYGSPKAEDIPIKEDCPQKPEHPYGESKLTVEKILDAYDKEDGLRSVRLRYFNVAGADSEGRLGEWHDPETHLIPNVLNATKEKPLNILGTDYDTPDGTCIRDYVNVEDLAKAHVKALIYLDKGGKTDYINLGTNTGNSVREVWRTCSDVVGEEIPYVEGPRRPGDPPILIADNKKAKRVLGWEPEKDLKSSVETAFNWKKKLDEMLKSK